MIKRNGVEIMNARTNNVSIAKETINITKSGHYTSSSGKNIDISKDIKESISGTILYKDTTFDDSNLDISPTLEVINETTAQAAVRLLSLGKTDIVALNFASARNPGGGFLSGAICQEEDLCRASSLYSCLKSKPIFYNENILCEDTYYTDNIIYSPNVPFFRSEQGELLDNPFKLSIISAPAPNVRAIEDLDKEYLYTVFLVRSIKILKIAEKHNHKNIILGAWGCGAFGNDPNMVVDALQDALQEVPSFEHVCFAVYDTRDNTPLFSTFNKNLLIT